MLELTVASFGTDQDPAISLEQPNDFAHLHKTTLTQTTRRVRGAANTSAQFLGGLTLRLQLRRPRADCATEARRRRLRAVVTLHLAMCLDPRTTRTHRGAPPEVSALWQSESQRLGSAR